MGGYISIGAKMYNEGAFFEIYVVQGCEKESAEREIATDQFQICPIAD